ncbi:MAG: recombination mediator RecR [Coriobacteriia bacterium]|nr:recombination mediator RecR [Coriobacteriia bacterium]MCL2746348.1 recombination mediator RecR [Coriobacteriia bacterium]MCL2871007.1 recombination mediator RecR [Coriobacteriia bacterium]
MKYPTAIQNALDELGRLPGIGPKGAQRITYWLLARNLDDAKRLTDSILELKESISFCPVCWDFAEGGGLCRICEDQRRDVSLLCIVEEPRDVMAIERTGEFRGRYHVLHGSISPMDGVGPEQLRIRELLERLAGDEVEEVILATNPNVEGETTAIFLAKTLKQLSLKVTRLASGLPVGGDLEFADELTLGKALEARRDM